MSMDTDKLLTKLSHMTLDQYRDYENKYGNQINDCIDHMTPQQVDQMLNIEVRINHELNKRIQHTYFGDDEPHDFLKLEAKKLKKN